MAAFGQTSAHLPHFVQVSSFVIGAGGSVPGLAARDIRNSSLYGRLPLTAIEGRSSLFLAVNSFSLIFEPNSRAFLRSEPSGRPAAMGTSGELNECSAMKAPPAMGLNPSSEIRSVSSIRASSYALLP